MKKNMWISKSNRGDTIEIILRDENKRKLETWIINISDKKRARQIVSSLKQSYGINLSSNIDEDLDWLRKR